MSQTFGYARASTAKQIQSPETQKQIIQDRCAQLGRAMDAFYLDAATSGKTPLVDREAGGAMMRSLRRGDHVVVARLDRISRSYIDFATTIDTWAKRGVVLHLCDLPGFVIDPENAIAMMVVQLLVTFAEFERKLIKSRTREAHARLRAMGRACGGRQAPHGFKKVWRKDGKAYLEPVPEEAKYALLAYKLRQAGASYDALVTYFNKLGIENPRSVEGTKAFKNKPKDKVHRWILLPMHRLVEGGERLTIFIEEGRWTPPPDMLYSDDLVGRIMSTYPFRRGRTSWLSTGQASPLCPWSDTATT